MMNKIIKSRYLCLNNVALQLPNWLTKDYIQNSLQHGKDYKISIQDLKVDMAVPKGNNFVCNVYRVAVQYINSNNVNCLRKTSLIVKEPIYGPMYDTVLKLGIEIEVKFYDILAPRLNTLFGITESIDKDDDQVLPKSYTSSEKNIVILEDLKPKGYIMVDRTYRCDWTYCDVIIKALAKFHAGGRAVLDEDPQMIELFTVLWNCDNMKKNLGPFHMTNFKNLADEFKNHPELEKYSIWLNENYETGLDKAFKLMDPRENDFNVIIHSDFGLHNLLFKFNDDVPIKVILIDYQGCRYTSPVIDLFYFLELFTEDDIWENRFDELVQLYVNELNCNLERYGSSSRLDKSQFKKLIEEKSYLRVFYSVAFLAVAIGMTPESEIYELNDFSDKKIDKSGTNPFQNYVKNETFIKVITKRFKEFEKMGLVKINNI